MCMHACMVQQIITPTDVGYIHPVRVSGVMENNEEKGFDDALLLWYYGIIVISCGTPLIPLHDREVSCANKPSFTLFLTHSYMC